MYWPKSLGESGDAPMLKRVVVDVAWKMTSLVKEKSGWELTAMTVRRSLEQELACWAGAEADRA